MRSWENPARQCVSLNAAISFWPIRALALAFVLGQRQSAWPRRGWSWCRLSANGAKWIACRKNFFLSVRVLSRLYRCLILEGLTKLHDTGKLQLFGDHAELVDRNTFDDFLKPLHQIDWGVYAKEPFTGPKAVLAYLSRYTHRVAISNSRLIRFDARSVTFRVKDYHLQGVGRYTTMTLATPEFVRRFLILVLFKGQHCIVCAASVPLRFSARAG